MGGINHHSIDKVDFGVHNSEFPFLSNYESIPDPDITPIKSIGDYEMDHILKLFRSEHNGDILDDDFQMLWDWLVVAPS